MTDFRELPIRDDLRELTPYGAPQLDVPVLLNTNENPYPPPAELLAELTGRITTAATSMNRYPDREATELRLALAGYLGHGLGVEQVWAANGSNEILQQILQAFGGPGRRALGFEPSYSMHRLIALATGTSWVRSGRRDDFSLSADDAVDAVAREQPDVVFLCRPNNPTGGSMPLDVVTAVHEATAGLVVVDEAYGEFSSSTSALTLLPGRPRLIVTRTMSKAFAFAGARVGYLAADPAVIDALRLVRLPYHLSVLTQAAALAALAHSRETLGQVAQIIRDRDALVSRLRSELGLEVVPADANFLLVGRFEDEGKVWQALLDQGVLVRDVGLARWLRVTVGTTTECATFVEALKAALG